MVISSIEEIVIIFFNVRGFFCDSLNYLPKCCDTEKKEEEEEEERKKGTRSIKREGNGVVFYFYLTSKYNANYFILVIRYIATRCFDRK